MERMREGGYAAQDRGDVDAYARYLAGMDASMRQKVALTAAHLLAEGRVADMGMGSGTGSHALAALYPRLEVVGVDIDPTIVALARRTHLLPNLSFVPGDIAGAVFPPGSLDGIFDSSVLHHVTSYRGYRHENVPEALANQVAQLRPHGVLVVRDFLDPGTDPVWLDVPAGDGAETGDVPALSTAALLERFAREFRALAPQPGFPIERLPLDRPGWRRYRLSHKQAAEFVLRKDYRADWATEVQEEYTYFTQAQFEALFARLGLRVLASTPLWNPWIVRHRFEGRFELRDALGAPLPWPATNYVIVGEKVTASEGVRFDNHGHAGAGFLRMEHHRQRETGRVYDLAYRPHPTVDVIPFFLNAGVPYVLARTSYPRPILRMGHPPLDGSGPAPYVTEPLNVVQDEAPLGRTVEDALEKTAGMAPSCIRSMLPGTTYYPSPGGILEEVRSVLVEVEPTYVNATLPASSGFASSGRVRAIEARQLLRAAQVGGLPDARLELNVHDLLLRLGIDRGPWIGEELRPTAAVVQTAVPVERLLARPGRRSFERAAAGDRPFLQVRAALFEERSAEGSPLGALPLEYVVPGSLSTNTLVTALLARDAGGRPLLGLDDDDLPAAQSFAGASNLLVAPAWRLPATARTVAEGIAFAAGRLAEEYGVAAGQSWELGGPYRPSPGLTPEVVHAVALEVVSIRSDRRPLLWVDLEELVTRRASFPDGHLRVAALRLSHALAARTG
jgi:SAM-dependent methyltransferase